MSTPEWLLEAEVGWGLPHPILALPGLVALALRSVMAGIARGMVAIRTRRPRRGGRRPDGGAKQAR